MDWNIINTAYLINNTMSKDEVIKYLSKERGLGVSTKTLDCYMSNYQQFPRFINVYNHDTLRREQRWLKADLVQWEPPKATRQRLKVEQLERQLADYRMHMPRMV